MTPVWLGAMLLAAIAPRVQGGEVWHELHATADVKVAVDVGSLWREKQLISFRERHVLLTAEVDPESLRRIVEIQYRRQADCEKRRLAILSRAVFSEGDGLVRYEATRRGRTAWVPPQGEADLRVYQWVCGGRARD